MHLGNLLAIRNMSGAPAWESLGMWKNLGEIGEK
jgi:hypothetical protein